MDCRFATIHPAPHALATPKSDVGGLVASRMRDESRLLSRPAPGWCLCQRTTCKFVIGHCQSEIPMPALSRRSLGEGGWPLTPISKNRRRSAARCTRYHALMGLPHSLFIFSATRSLARPHPGLLPQGEGRAIVLFCVRGRASGERSLANDKECGGRFTLSLVRRSLGEGGWRRGTG